MPMCIVKEGSSNLEWDDGSVVSIPFVEIPTFQGVVSIVILPDEKNILDEFLELGATILYEQE